MRSATESSPPRRTALTLGRLARAGTGAVLLGLALRVVAGAPGTYTGRVATGFVVLTMLYTLLHWLVVRYFGRVNGWLGAVLAVSPVTVALFLGGDAWQVAALAFIGVSLLIDAASGDAGCEVMAIPALVLGRRTHLVCIVFTPLDWAERTVTGRKSPLSTRGDRE